MIWYIALALGVVILLFGVITSSMKTKYFVYVENTRMIGLILIIVTLFALAVCVMVFVRGASTLDIEERSLLNTRTEAQDAKHRDAA